MRHVINQGLHFSCILYQLNSVQRNTVHSKMLRGMGSVFRESKKVTVALPHTQKKTQETKGLKADMF